MSGIVFNIERFAVHDGPGIRTLVFLKGCPLRCLWCQNPEGLKREPELLFHLKNCTGCGECVRNCPVSALTAGKDGIIRDADKCTLCFRCTEVCPTGVWEKCGSVMDSDEVIAQVMRDQTFYAESGGGVTLTGGDPLLQPDFAAEILKKSRDNYIHTAVESCTAFGTDVLEKLVPYTDLFLCDIKHMDNDTHKKLTGAGNSRTLENISFLDSINKSAVIRVPLIPGFNDDEENLANTAGFIQTLKNIDDVQLLGYNNLCISKYPLVGMECRIKTVEHYPDDKLLQAEELFRSMGIIVSKANS